EIPNVDVRKHRLPHPGQVADDVADRRKQHAFDEVETARDAKLHRGTRNAADVALVIGVAMDDFELITAPYDAKRKHARSMNDLAGHVDRQISDHLAARLRRLPLARRGE